MTPSSIALHILLIQVVSRAIQITKLEVPRSLAVGDSGILECEWEDEGDHVYTLKWYLGIYEFYRWTPLETPEVKTFPIQHFSVDTQASQRGHVLIQNVSVNAGGHYRCEVSGEAPYFKTSFTTGYMTVVDLPNGVPRITSNDQEPYRLHQLVTITCLSRDAQPPPSLTFYLNQQPVDPQWEVNEQVLVNSTTGLQTAVRSLKFQIRPTMMAPGGVLQVTCVADHPDLYWESTVKEFTVDLPDSFYRPSASRGVVSYSAEPSSSSLSLLTTLIVLMAGVCLR